MSKPKFIDSKISKSIIVKELDEKGYVIIDKMIDHKMIMRLSKFWSDHFEIQLKKRPKVNAVRGNLHLGEKNFTSYSDNKEWNIYRTFFFYWNKNYSVDENLTKDISIELHKFRNKIQGLNESEGLEYSPNGYGTYLSISHYQPNKGFLRTHEDAHDGHPILQYMVNLTFKNIDYQNGGLHIIKNDKKIDIDSRLKPGSVLFFYGNISHGVDKIISDKKVGRIAFFSIPTYFLVHDSIPKSIRFIEKIFLGIQRYFSKN